VSKAKCRVCGGYGSIFRTVSANSNVTPEPCPACKEHSTAQGQGAGGVAQLWLAILRQHEKLRGMSDAEVTTDLVRGNFPRGLVDYYLQQRRAAHEEEEG
jgi:hypothetical protein